MPRTRKTSGARSPIAGEGRRVSCADCGSWIDAGARRSVTITNGRDTVLCPECHGDGGTHGGVTVEPRSKGS